MPIIQHQNRQHFVPFASWVLFPVSPELTGRDGLETPAPSPLRLGRPEKQRRGGGAFPSGCLRGYFLSTCAAVWVALAPRLQFHLANMECSAPIWSQGVRVNSAPHAHSQSKGRPGVLAQCRVQAGKRETGTGFLRKTRLRSPSRLARRTPQPRLWAHPLTLPPHWLLPASPRLLEAPPNAHFTFHLFAAAGEPQAPPMGGWKCSSVTRNYW